MDREGSPIENADLLANRAREKQPDFTAAGAMLVRAGYRALVGSVVVTLIGTIVLAQGRASFQSTASAVRGAGGILMLISCILVLLGYRTPQLWRFCQKMQETEDGIDTLNRDSDSTSSPQARFSLKGLLVLMTLLAIVFCALFVTPDPVLAIFVAYLYMMFVAMCIILIVYDRGWLRTFCIAAIVPAALSFWMVGMLSRSLMQSGRGYYGVFDDRFPIAFHCGMIVIIGVLGVGVRYYLAVGARRNGRSGH